MSTKLYQIKEHLRKVGCASGMELAGRFSISLRRLSDYLRALGCLTSYSHKRRYYALSGTAKFNKCRIWKCRRVGALFTDLGSLSALVEWHVRESPAGLTCRDLSAVTGVRVEPHIVRIARERRLVRLKFDGEYVYFYRSNEKVYRSQLAKRTRFSSRGSPEPVGLAEAEADALRRDLSIALALLNHPSKSGRAIADMLAGEGIHVTVDDLAEFLLRYGIKKKDDTPDGMQLELIGVAAKLQRALIEKGMPLRACCILLEPPTSHCTHCRSTLYVQKTTAPRAMRSIRYGNFWIKERVKTCPTCPDAKVWHSEVPALLAPAKRRLAYDVMTFIGEQKFLIGQTNDAIRAILGNQYGITVSPSVLSLYVQEFCYRFECLHYAKLAKLAQWTKEEQLGYMLHVDCSSEQKSDTVFVAYDRTSEIVLLSEKIPSERMPFLVPVLGKVKEYMGDPVSSMSDLGLGIIKALEEVFPDVRRRICHFHFIRDVGKDLLDESYGELRTRLNESEINAQLNALERDILSTCATTSLEGIDREGPLLRRCSRDEYGALEPVLVLHYIRSCAKVKGSTGFGYPFDLPRVRYLEEVCRRATEVRHCLTVLRKRRIEAMLLKRLGDLLSGFAPDGKMYEEMYPVLHRCLIREQQLQELRRAMRLMRPEKGRAPLSAAYGVTSRKEILKFNKDLGSYRTLLRGRQRSKGQTFRKEGYKIIIGHLEKYWGNLILHPSLWRALQCQVVDRTNNLPESGHRDTKRPLRRASGRRQIHREYSNYGPYLPVISNLKNAMYVERVLGEHENLPLEFARLDQDEVAYYRERFQEARHGAMYRAVRTVSESTIL